MSEQKRCRDCGLFNGSQFCGYDGRFTAPENPACEHFSEVQEKISITHTKQGWIISCGNKSVEIGQRLEDLEKVIDAEVASKLGVEAKELQAVRLGILAKCTEPTEGVRVENAVITVDFDTIIKSVHPAIDIVDDTAFVGVWLPCIIATEPQKLVEPAKVEEEDLHWLITSHRKKILTYPKILRELKLKLAYQAINIADVGWSLKSIQNFLDHPTLTIDLAEFYLTIKGKWKEFIETDDPRLYDLLTLWTIGTYFCSLFRCYPYLYIGGVRRAGKTKVLDLIALLAFNAISSASITTASAFRLIQSGRCTLLMDEDETLSNPERRQDFRSILLKGYKRGGRVYRVEEDSKKKRFVQGFAVYSAKSICNISGLDDVLEDRTIPIIMKRGKDKAIINKEIDSEDPIFSELRDKIFIFFLTHWSEIKEIYDACDSSDASDTPAGEGLLKSRDWELWRPIWVLAKFFSRYLPPAEETQVSEASQVSLTNRIKQLAVEISRQREIENMTETRECLLIRALLNLATKDNWYAVQTIREEFEKQFDEPQEWLSNDWIGRALKRLKFFEKRRVGTGREWFLKPTIVEDLAERMGVEKQVQEEGLTAIEKIKNWILDNKDEAGTIDVLKLSDYIKNLGLDPVKTITHLKEEGFLSDLPNKTEHLGKLLVV